MTTYLVITTGWTFDYIEEALTLSRVNALFGFYDQHPPLFRLFEAFVGYKPSVIKTVTDVKDLAELPGTEIKRG